MKLKIEIKNRFTDKVIFELETENNTVKRTLEEAIKSGADLSSADLSRANLSGAYLSRADLSSANLSSAYLSRADLSRADLSIADLSGADLSRADLSSADLSSANLSSANLSRANLSGANLSSADLCGAKNADFAIASTRILPEGDIVGFKKCQNNIIVKLLIPREAKRSSAFGRKCRAEYADVLEIEGAEKAFAQYDSTFVYEVGKRVRPDSFDENFQKECSSGIHFFITRLEAEKY